MAGQGKKTFIAGEVLTAQDVNDYLADQVVFNFASDAARSSAIPTPTEGMLALSKDTQQINYYNGSDFVPALPMGAWQTWAPTLSGGWANGNGVWTASYAQIGKIVHVRGKFVVGSTTTKGTGLTISLPVTTASAAVNSTSIPPALTIAGGSNTQILWGFVGTSGTFTLFALNAAATYLQRTGVTATIPQTWATSDEIHFSFTYQAA
jgi:hypothetical protein